MPLKVRYLWDGAQYTLYALELGDEHDYDAFRKAMRRDRSKEMATMIQRLERLADHGITAKTQNFNDLGDGLWEAKTSGGLRVTFFRRGTDIFILDSGLAKKTPKIKPADLQRALKRRELFEEQLDSGVAPTVLLNRGQEPRRKLT